MDDPRKNPVKVEAGRKGARERWGPPRVVRMDQLNADERAIVEALLRLKESREHS